jgi:gas vesicle protein
MLELIATFLVSTPLGQFLFVIAIAAVIILLFFAIRKGYTFHKDEKGKWHVEPGAKKQKGVQTDEAIRRTTSDIETILDLASKDENEIKTNTRKEILKIQEDALRNAISSMVIEYPKKYTTPADEPERLGEILELYLKRDLISVVSAKLDMIKTSSTFLRQTEIDITQRVPGYTEEVITDMLMLMKNYALLGTHKDLTEFFEDSKKTIKETLDQILKSFLRLSLNEQTKIKEIYDDRLRKIENKIKSMYGE